MSRARKEKPSTGQLAFIPGEYAEHVMPAAWRMSLQGATERKNVLERYGAFRDRVASLNRHRLLSLSALYTLTGGQAALQRKAAYPEVAELEFLQAVALSCPENTNENELAPDEVLPFWRELSTQCFVASHDDDSIDQSALEGLARIHAAYYRNPYGDAFFDRMMLAVTGEYDDRYVRDGSFASAGKSIVELRRVVWNRFAKHIEQQRTIVKGGRAKVSEILRALSSSDEPTAPKELEDLRARAFQLAEDAAMGSLFRLDDDWIGQREQDGLPIRSVLERLSLTSIEPLDPKKIVSSNPIWSAPIVKAKEGYVLYGLLTLTSFPFRCLLKLLDDKEQAKARLEKVRGWFVEQESLRIFRDAFPSAQIVSSAYWQRSPDQRVETDLIVLVAKRLFIVEAKGALIPDRVRFGVRDATAHFLRKIWGKANLQGSALESHVLASSDAIAIHNKGDVVMTIDPKAVLSVSRFGVSVEQVGPLVNAPKELKAVAVLGDNVVPAPCFMLAEIAQVMKHAGNELERLHYLLRRSELAKEYEIVGDEMDIYTTYVQFGFSDLPPPENRLMMLGASYSLEEYQDQSGRVTLPSDSALRCSPFFSRVLREAKKRNTPAYLEVGLLLMDMPLRQQMEFERQLQKILKKKPKRPDWPVAMTAISSLKETFGLCVVLVDKSTTIEERREIGFNVLAEASRQLKATHAACLVVLWKGRNAYDALYVGNRSLFSVNRFAADL